MSDNTGDQAYARDAKLQPAVAWLALFVFFIGCGCFTVAVVELAGNKSTSAVAALIGAPLFLIGLVTLIVTGKLRGQD
jgi:pheromone shutdown protein TraB